MGRKNWVASVGMTVGGDLPTHARKERRGPSTAQPNHLTGSEMGRKNWVASVGMTVGGDLRTHARTTYPPPAHHLPTHGKRREVPPLRNPTISREVRWEEKIGLLRSG